MNLIKQFARAMAKKDAPGCETKYVSETEQVLTDTVTELKLTVATEALRKIECKTNRLAFYHESGARVVNEIASDALKAVE
jgi:hypothetical protein